MGVRVGGTGRGRGDCNGCGGLVWRLEFVGSWEGIWVRINVIRTCMCCVQTTCALSFSSCLRPRTGTMECLFLAPCTNIHTPGILNVLHAPSSGLILVFVGKG